MMSLGASDHEPSSAASKEKANELYLSTKPGLNRFVLDLRYPDCTKLESDPTRGTNTGPLAVQGTWCG